MRVCAFFVSCGGVLFSLILQAQAECKITHEVYQDCVDTDGEVCATRCAFHKIGALNEDWSVNSEILLARMDECPEASLHSQDLSDTVKNCFLEKGRESAYENCDSYDQVRFCLKEAK